MAEGTPVREYCLRMISCLNILEVLGANIDRESQVDMILQSLLESFMEFRINYNMNKKIYTLSELMNELVATEGSLGTASVDVNMAEAFTSQPKLKGKVKRRRRRTSPSKIVNKLPYKLPTREIRRTMPKESVSIVARKVIERGIVQNSELPIIRV